jgi:hypothetical protein
MDNFRVDLVPNCDPYSGREDRDSNKRRQHSPESRNPEPDEVVLSSPDGDAEAETSNTYSPQQPDRRG